ncbi:uncharacterized protein [Palaemon carinicauda]|uniref:uncharacterized protein n=1 Tax=Palaemon carinicauda TaxID=392227 RepID=UPI0035B65445
MATLVTSQKKLIGVHCTHGLNRSGYLVCRYMIEHLGVPPDQAISDFNSARGHEQEREEYLNNLRQLKWQQDPAVSSDSEKEEATEVKTPTDNQRRGKRNYDAFRDEDDDDESWPSGPTRKWPRTPHTQRRNYDQPNGNNRTPNQNFNQRSSENPKHKVKTSPYGGQRYYDSYYQGRTAPQYDFNFYQQQGSGLGPYRNSPRWSKNVHWENNNTQGRPRQYQGPRQYATPHRRERERETLDDSGFIKFRGNTSGPRRNPFSSPGDANTLSPTPYRHRKNPFSPETSNNIFSPEDSKTFSIRTSKYQGSPRTSSNPFSPEDPKTYSPGTSQYHKYRFSPGRGTRKYHNYRHSPGTSSNVLSPEDSKTFSLGTPKYSQYRK